MRLLETVADLEDGVAAITQREPRFGSVAARGLPALRRRGQGFATLIAIITEQMISVKAAEAILNRMRAALESFDPNTICGLRAEKLQALGLSRAKARSVLALAEAAATGRLNLDELPKLTDDDVRRRLIAHPGIGPWTAEIYLLTALGRPDAWPKGDVALQRAAQRLFGLAAKPEEKAMQALAEPWRPWRSVAARLLWAHYRHIRGLSPAVEEEDRPLHRLVTQDIVGTAGTQNVPEV